MKVSTIQYTLKDIYRFQRYHITHSPKKWFFRVVGFVLLLTGLTTLVNKSPNILLLILGILGVIFLIPHITAYIIAFFYYKQIKSYTKKFDIEFTQRSVKIFTKNEKSFSKWDAFIHFDVVDNCLLLLYKSQKTALLIPKRKLSQKKWKKLIELVNSRIQQKNIYSSFNKKLVISITTLVVLPFLIAFIQSITFSVQKPELQITSSDQYYKKETQNLPEARQWLEANHNTHSFAGNRFSSTQEALSFINQLYALGAENIFIDNIYSEEWRIQQEGGAYADTLIIELPKNTNLRVQLFEKINQEIVKQGFTAEEDKGQRYIMLWWD